MALACKAVACVMDTMVHCEQKHDHPHEHEGQVSVFVAVEDEERETPVLVWWGDDGHAFVGSKNAVETGRIGAWDD